MKKLFEKACCFVGSKSIPIEEERQITARINKVLDRLISKDFFQFYTNGASGFDLLAARAVLARRRSDPRVRLFLTLSCPMQSEGYSPRDQYFFEMVEEEADAIDLLTCYQSPGTNLNGRLSMVRESNVCVCYGQLNEGEASFLKQRAADYCLKLIYLVEATPLSARGNWRSCAYGS